MKKIIALILTVCAVFSFCSFNMAYAESDPPSGPSRGEEVSDKMLSTACVSAARQSSQVKTTPVKYFPMDSYDYIEAYNRSNHALGTLTKDSNTMEIDGTNVSILFFVSDVSNQQSGATWGIPEMEFNQMMIRLIARGNNNVDAETLSVFIMIGQTFAEIFDPTFDSSDFVNNQSMSYDGENLTMTYSHAGFDYAVTGTPVNSIGYFYEFYISISNNVFSAERIESTGIDPVTDDDFVYSSSETKSSNMLQEFKRNGMHIQGYYYDPTQDASKVGVITTARGIHIGDSKTSVIKAYGENYITHENITDEELYTSAESWTRALLRVGAVTHIHYLTETNNCITFCFDENENVTWIIFSDNTVTIR